MAVLNIMTSLDMKRRHNRLMHDHLDMTNKISCVSKFYVAFMLGLKNSKVFDLLVRSRQIACKEAIKLALNDLQLVIAKS